MNFKLTSFALLGLASLVSSQTVTLLRDTGEIGNIDITFPGVNVELDAIGTNVAATETTYLEKVGITQTLTFTPISGTVTGTPSVTTLTLAATATIIDSPVTQIALGKGDSFVAVQSIGCGKGPGAMCIGNDNGFSGSFSFTAHSAFRTVTVRPPSTTGSPNGKSSARGSGTSLVLMLSVLAMGVFALV